MTNKKVTKSDVDVRIALVDRLLELAFAEVAGADEIPKLPDLYMELEVSKATMREEDLIPTFMKFLRDHSLLMYWNVILSWGDESVGYEDTSEFLETLFNSLNEIAPDGCYFGAHEGDGASYGFWIASKDSFDNERDYKAVCRRAKAAGRWL